MPVGVGYKKGALKKMGKKVKTSAVRLMMTGKKSKK